MTRLDRPHVIMPAAGSSRRIAHLTRDKPKALLKIGTQSIIAHSLDILASRGFSRVTFVVGYKKALFMNTLGPRYGRLRLDYVVADDYETTEHGWSLYLTRDMWCRDRPPVMLMDADNLYDPRLLDRVLESPRENVILVDERFSPAAREEELVLGRDGRVNGLARGLAASYDDYAGGFVGINRFSSDFMNALYPFMENLLAERGRLQKYERVLDAFLRQTGAAVHYVTTDGLEWININHEEDYALANALAGRMRLGARRAAADRGDHATPPRPRIRKAR